MKHLKRNVKGITLIALVVTIIVLLILAGISIHVLIGEDTLINLAKSTANEYMEKAEEEQKGLNEVGEYFNDMDDEIEKPQLPEVDTNAQIERLGTYDEVSSELNSNYEKLSSYINTNGEYAFNDKIFTVYNYKLTDPTIDQWENATPNWYMADATKQTRSVACEFNTSCKDFRLAGVGGFRLSVWDYNKNKWQYVLSKTGIDEERDSIYSITFSDARQRTVRIETLDAFYRIVCKKRGHI